VKGPWPQSGRGSRLSCGRLERRLSFEKFISVKLSVCAAFLSETLTSVPEIRHSMSVLADASWQNWVDAQEAPARKFHGDQTGRAMPRNCRQSCNGQRSRRTGTPTRVGMGGAPSNTEHVHGAERTSSENEGIDHKNGGIPSQILKAILADSPAKTHGCSTTDLGSVSSLPCSPASDSERPLIR
jgi:hypothetical protein